MSSMKDMSKIIKSSKYVYNIDYNKENNILEVTTTYLYETGEVLVLYLLEYENQEFCLTDMAYIQEYIENLEIKIDIKNVAKEFGLMFDGKSIYSSVSVKNCDEIIENYIKFLKNLGL